MTILSIINMKGGVAKTTSADNIAYTLAEVHGKRVLVIDNDKQGNTSAFFGVHSYERPSLAEVLTIKGYDIRQAIAHTQYLRIDVLPANMTLLRANKEILLDCSWVQQTRLRKALKPIEADYDFIIIDNAPDLNMSVINALVASHDVLIPIKIDRFAFDGLAQLLEQVEDVRDFNEDIRVAGCFVTMYQRNKVNDQGEEWLQGNAGVPMFHTMIRKTVKVDETTFHHMPLLAYDKRCTAALDYVALVAEYLGAEG